MDPLDALMGPIIIVAADIVVFALVGRLGKKSYGHGVKYQPFTGGEETVPTRGLYRSNLFVFAALFMVVEAFALLLAGSFLAPNSYYPFLFLVGGSSVIMPVVWWMASAGGGGF
jgi:NADH:ubiquinone oxidoreductase subunit 3 (subunit A)